MNTINEDDLKVKVPPRLPAKGFVDPDKVRAVAFYVVTLCVLFSVVSCILAIWDFTQRDTLWRTFSTCMVIAGGCGAFSFVNTIFARPAKA